MPPPWVPERQVCAAPGCNEIVVQEGEGGSTRLYHSAECQRVATWSTLVGSRKQLSEYHPADTQEAAAATAEEPAEAAEEPTLLTIEDPDGPGLRSWEDLGGEQPAQPRATETERETGPGQPPGHSQRRPRDGQRLQGAGFGARASPAVPRWLAARRKPVAVTLTALVVAGAACLVAITQLGGRRVISATAGAHDTPSAQITSLAAAPGRVPADEKAQAERPPHAGVSAFPVASSSPQPSAPAPRPASPAPPSPDPAPPSPKQVSTTGSAQTLDAKTFEDGGTDGLVNWYGDTISNSTAQAHSGTHSLQIASSGAFWGVETNWPGQAHVTPGVPDTFTGWLKASPGSASATVTVTVGWINSGGTEVSSQTFSATDNPSGWTQFSHTLTPPSGAATAWETLSSDDGGKHYLDDMLVTSP